MMISVLKVVLIFALCFGLIVLQLSALVGLNIFELIYEILKEYFNKKKTEEKIEDPIWRAEFEKTSFLRSVKELDRWADDHLTDEIVLTSNFKDYLILKDGKAFWKTERDVKIPENPTVEHEHETAGDHVITWEYESRPILGSPRRYNRRVVR